MSKSVIKSNVALDSTIGALFYSATKFTDSTTSGNLVSRLYGLKNSTIFSNTGYILNLRDGMFLNNLTALRNTKGLFLDAPLGNAAIANSILLEKRSI